jgi:hypothetical protein
MLAEAPTSSENDLKTTEESKDLVLETIRTSLSIGENEEEDIPYSRSDSVGSLETSPKPGNRNHRRSNPRIIENKTTDHERIPSSDSANGNHVSPDKHSPLNQIISNKEETNPVSVSPSYQKINISSPPTSASKDPKNSLSDKNNDNNNNDDYEDRVSIASDSTVSVSEGRITEQSTVSEENIFLTPPTTDSAHLPRMRSRSSFKGVDPERSMSRSSMRISFAEALVTAATYDPNDTKSPLHSLELDERGKVPKDEKKGGCADCCILM